MRIAMLAYRGTMRSGGLGIYIRDLTRELAARGHAIDLYVGPPYPDPLPWLHSTTRIHNEHYWDRRFTDSWAAPLPRGNPLRALEPLHFFELLVTRFGFLPEPFAFSARAARRMVAQLRAGVRYDLIHDVQTLGYGVLVLRALGLPVVSTIHHPLTVDRRTSLERDRTFKEMKGTLTFYPVRSQARVARRIDAVITSSEASIGEIERGFGVRRARIHNVGNGVALPTAGRLRPPPERPELLFIGRVGDPNKGFEHLLAALAQLPEAIRLRVIDVPPLERGDPVRDLITELKLESRISFEGKLPREQLEAELRDAAVLVVPSIFEGFGLPVVEALASGTPIVTTTSGALSEVVARAGTGTLVPPRDPGALARAILHTLGNWPALQAEAVHARERIEREFGWGAVAQRTEQVYAAALGRPVTTITSDADGNQRAAQSTHANP
jgi:glycosyltransferase involved in cell wall biosynthesis